MGRGENRYRRERPLPAGSHEKGGHEERPRDRTAPYTWDANTVTDRLESAVGRDLQYIRINGTIVGGLVGLIIHSIEVLT